MGDWAGSSTRGALRGWSRAALLLAVGLSGATFVMADFSIHRSMIVLLFFGVTHVASGRESMFGRRSDRIVVGLTLSVLAVAAVAEYPDGSDMWIYQSYGRMVTEHGANPFVRVPNDFPGDPVIDRVIPMYRDDPSVYGPVLVAGATVVSAVVGESATAGRIVWQSVGLFAVVVIALLLHRRRVGASRLWWFVASPLVVYQLVNQAHNDVFIGLMLLGACLAAERGRVVATSMLLAAAALVKAPVGIALVVYIAWLLARRERRAAVSAIFVAALFALVVSAPFGWFAVVRPMLDAGGSVNATSIWNLVRGDAATFVWRPLRSIETDAGRWLVMASTILPLVIAVAAALRARHRPFHEPLTVALLGWFVLALHPSVWYLGWAVPLFALWGESVSRRLTIYSTLCLITSQAWLMPVASALVGDGRLRPVDRLAALSLGIVTAMGVWLVTRLSVSLVHGPDSGERR